MSWRTEYAEWRQRREIEFFRKKCRRRKTALGMLVKCAYCPVFHTVEFFEKNEEFMLNKYCRHRKEVNAQQTP